MRARVYLRAFTLTLLLVEAAPALGQVSPNNQYGLPVRGQSPRGWVLVVHGGGWQIVGKAAVAAARSEADFFGEHGWGTYNIDYRPGYLSLRDVLSAYDLLRKHAGGKPVCAWGGSAGGHLVLMLAGLRSSLNCAITEGAPTDLVTFDSEPAWPASEPHAGPDWIMRTFIVPSFGDEHLWWWSPVRLAKYIHARVLMGASADDPFVPQTQLVDMRRADPAVRSMILGSGDAPFTHAGVSARALAEWKHAELRLLTSARSIGR